MNTSSRFLQSLIFAAFSSSGLAQTTPPASEYEQGIILSAATLLPAELLKGPSHRVRDQVFTDGYMAHFTIDTDFGIYKAAGVLQAKQRIAEANAIRKLVETSKSDLFAEGLKRSIEKPIDAVANIVDDPVNSLKQAPRTVGHFFGKVGSSLGKGIEKAAKAAEGTEPAPSAEEVSSGIGKTASKVSGFDKAKLETARQLGVDPYSDNQRLQEEMDKVTWAFFAGGLPLKIGTMGASAGLALTATKMVGIPEDTYALTAPDLEAKDKAALLAMGVTEQDIKAFQRNPVLNVTRRHQITRALQGMQGAQGRGLIIRLANSLERPEQGNFLAAAMQLLANRQQAGASKYTGFTVTGRLPAAATDTGEFHVPAPVDFVTWTEQVAAFAQRDDLGDSPKFLLHTGTLSPKATAGFTAAKWSTVATSL